MKTKVLSLLLAALLLSGLVLPVAAFADGETYTVSFAPGTGAGSMASVTVSAGEDYTLPACTFTHTNSERVFYKWSVGGELKDPGDTITVSADTTVTALWVYTASSSLVNNTQDKSTTNYVGKLVMTDTRTGTTTTETLYDETASSAYTEPMNSEVASLTGNCISTLMTTLYSYPNANFISDDKPTLDADHAEVVDSWNHITYRFEEAPDDAGDYVRTMYMEGDYGNAWRFTETVTGEYTSAEELPVIPSVSLTFTPPAVGTSSTVKPVLTLPEGETRYTDWGGYPAWAEENPFTIEAGQTYRLYMEVANMPGYRFDENETTVTVTNATVDSWELWEIYEGRWVMGIVFSFTAQGEDPAPTPEPIEEVVLSVYQPTIGETTETESPDVTAGDWKYEVTDAIWVDSAGNALSSPLAFESGATYYISATVRSYWDWDSTYLFPLAGMTVTVENGELVGAPSIINIYGAASTMQVLIAVQAVVKRPADQIQVWVGSIDGNTTMAESGGKVATTYTPSELNIYDFGKDGTFYAGDIVQFYPGDEITVTAQADTGYHLVGWYRVNIDYNMSGGDTDHNGNTPNKAYMGSVISSATSFTYKPGVTVLSGDTEPLRYICAVFEKNPTPSHPYDEIQVWIGNAAGDTPEDAFTGGKVAVSYTPSYDDYPEEVAAKDGTAFDHGQIFGCYVGDSVTLYAQPDAGYRFVGWYLADGAWPAHGPEKYTGERLSDQTSYSFELSSTNRLICAVFEQIPPEPSAYTVAFDTDGAAALPPQTVAAGGKITKPADPVKEDFAFAGWYQDTALTTPFDFDAALTADTAIYAKWAAADYVLTAVTGATADASHAWTKGGTGDVVITVKLNDGVDHSFGHFTGVQIDGTALVRDTDYTAREGSTIVTLKAAMLEKLSIGAHTVTILFDNGQTQTTLTIKAAPGTGSGSSAAQTGDDSKPALWCAMLFLCTLSFVGLVRTERKERRMRQP